MLPRACETEILDGDDVPWHLAERSYRELTWLHRVLGDTAAILRALRRETLPVRRVLDVGCGAGGLLVHIRRQTGAEVVGMDLRPAAAAPLGVRILHGDAVRDPLPEADVCVAVCLIHHLSDAELMQLIANVGRSCRRLIISDPVRHRLPLALFRTFVAPFVSEITASDGMSSIRRSYTPPELREVVGRALAGSGARYRHSVTPFYTRQVVEIAYCR